MCPQKYVTTPSRGNGRGRRHFVAFVPGIPRVCVCVWCTVRTTQANAFLVPPHLSVVCVPQLANQVKAFRFMGCVPRRPFRLTVRAKENARSRLRGETPRTGTAAGRFASPTTAGENPGTRQSGKGSAADGRRGGVESDGDGGGGGGGGRGARRVRRSNRYGFGMNSVQGNPCGSGLGLGSDLFGDEGLGLGGDWEAAAEAAVAAAEACGEGGGRGGGGKKSERKRLACGMCGALRIPEDVSFRMTAKMIRETLFHVSCWGEWLK